MPVDKLEAIFDRFYSDRPQTDRTVGKNSGLGLSISRARSSMPTAAASGRATASCRPAGAERAGGPTRR